MPGLFAAGEVGWPDCTAPTGSVATPSRDLDGLRQARRGVRGEVLESSRAKAPRLEQRRRRHRSAPKPSRRSIDGCKGDENGVRRSSIRAAGHDAGPTSASSERKTRCAERPRRRREAQGSRASRPSVCASANREYNPGWHTGPRPRRTCSSMLRSHRPRAPLSGRKAAAVTFATTTRTRIEGRIAAFNIVMKPRRWTAAMQLERRPIPPMPAELKAIIEEQKG